MSPHIIYANLKIYFGILTEIMSAGWSTGGKSTDTIWPNALVLVGELQSLPFEKVIHLTGNLMVWMFALIGVMVSGFYHWRRSSVFGFSNYLFLFIFWLPLPFLAFQGVHFVIMAVLPLAFCITFGSEAIGLYWREWATVRLRKFAKPVVFERLFWLVVCLGVMWPTILKAQSVSSFIQKERVMNDAWFEALTEMREQTPKDAIIYSWLGPGYFIESISRRRVVLDGGSQMSFRRYWVAKALLTGNELQALRILKMLSYPGNQPVTYLRQLSLSEADAFALMVDLFSVPREEAYERLPSVFSQAEKESIIALAYDRKTVPPGYIFLYNDLISKNLALSYIANWDFRKARQLLKEKGNTRKEKDLDQYLSQVTNRWHYTPELRVLDKVNGLTRFQQNLEINIETMEVNILNPERTKRVKPESLYRLQDDKFIKKRFNGKVAANVSVLLLERAGRYSAVIGHPDLLQSLLFRLYYLKGVGLRYVKLRSVKASQSTNTFLYLFEIDWDTFLADERKNRQLKSDITVNHPLN